MLFLLLFTSLTQDLPAGPGKETVLKICRDCHDLDTITAENRTRENWKKTVDKMIDRGADGTNEEFEIVVNYLTKSFGKINVNKASAEEIASGLDFSAKESATIVEYREKNGPYKSWKDLTTVIDPAKVEAKKDHIAVQ
ncbi:MAG: helix-hairpin-helix domain-containing protein [Bryobacteraceae bacterium]